MSQREHLPSFEGTFSPLAFRDGAIDMLDQTLLPGETDVVRLTSVAETAEAIRVMRVRGAPAIGVTAAYGMVLAATEDPSPEAMAAAASALFETRPTAVNLGWALDRMLAAFHRVAKQGGLDIQDALLAEAHAIHREDIAANRAIGEAGAALLPVDATVLTICNTGALATGGLGTAFGVIRTAHELGHLRLAYACETRPRLQGARLTAWELLYHGIPFRLIADGAAGALLHTRSIDAVLSGADRIARNGDTANKIGTYGLAVLAQHHDIPFYAVAPTSTIDPATLSGDAIPIEERDTDEVLFPRGVRFAPEGAEAWNPAFDVTPAELITGIVTERGVHRPPFDFQEADAGPR
jgi:methylthioribose-1-phosphate isomerase